MLSRALQKLPPSIPDPTLKLHQLISEFSSELDGLVRSDAEHLELIRQCNDAYMSFCDGIEATAPRFQAQTSDEARQKKLSATSKVQSMDRRIRVNETATPETLLGEGELDDSCESSNTSRYVLPR
jgi:hypothetical protein